MKSISVFMGKIWLLPGYMKNMGFISLGKLNPKGTSMLEKHPKQTQFEEKVHKICLALCP